MFTLKTQKTIKLNQLVIPPHFQPYVNHDPSSISTIADTGDHIVLLTLLTHLDSFEVYIIRRMSFCQLN